VVVVAAPKRDGVEPNTGAGADVLAVVFVAAVEMPKGLLGAGATELVVDGGLEEPNANIVLAVEAVTAGAGVCPKLKAPALLVVVAGSEELFVALKLKLPAWVVAAVVAAGCPNTKVPVLLEAGAAVCPEL